MFKWMTGALVLVTATTAVAQTPRADDGEQLRARQRISMMERVLEGAVQNGAENLLQQIRSMMPGGDGPMLVGQLQARGFRLENFGVFFDVAVPDFQPPLSWVLGYLPDANALAARSALADVQAAVRQHMPDSEERRTLERALSVLEQQVGPAPSPSLRQRPVSPAASQAIPVGSTLASPAQTLSAQASPMAEMLANPNQFYTREVRSAIIDAMLENSQPIAIGPDEWLVVGARGSNQPVVGDLLDARSLLFRVKGSDLAAFRAGAITVEEARARVEVRED